MIHKNPKTRFVDSVDDHRSFQIMLSFVEKAKQISKYDK